MHWIPITAVYRVVTVVPVRAPTVAVLTVDLPAPATDAIKGWYGWRHA